MTIDELEVEIRNLSDDDKVRLFERFGLVSPFINDHIAVEIDDTSIERQTLPEQYSIISMAC